MDVFDAIVLAGGGGRRLGGVDKAALEVGTDTLLTRALRAVAGAQRVVVVGPGRDLVGPGHEASGPLRVVSEDPPGGGPVAAVAAGIRHVTAPVVVVLACDMPFVTAATIDRLVGAAGASTDGALLVDPAGRHQYLTAAYRRDALSLTLSRLDRVDGAAMRIAVRPLTLTEIAADAEVTLDCDTWEDVERSRRILEERR